METNKYSNLIKDAFEDHADVLKETLITISDSIEKSADIIAKSLASV